MTRMRHLLTLLGLTALLGACGGGEEPAPEIEVIVGAFAAPNSPWDQHWRMFKQTVEDRSDGRIQVRLLTKGEAGGESTTMTNIRRGRMHFGGFTLSGSAPVVPELDVLLSPFFFQSRAEVDFVMDAYLLEKFRALFAQKNLHLVQWVEVGWLNMYGKGPMLTPADAAGRRLRAQASIAAQIFMTSLGAEMIQMEFAELIPALQTGMVFGGETNAVLYAVTGLAGEAPHMTLTEHSYDTGIIVANRDWLDGLDPEDREIIATGFVSSKIARGEVRAMADALMGSLEDQGVSLYDLTEAQRRSWVEATKGNSRRIVEAVGGEAEAVLDLMTRGRAAHRARDTAEAEAAPGEDRSKAGTAGG